MSNTLENSFHMLGYPWRILRDYLKDHSSSMRCWSGEITSGISNTSYEILLRLDMSENLDILLNSTKQTLHIDVMIKRTNESLWFQSCAGKEPN